MMINIQQNFRQLEVEHEHRSILQKENIDLFLVFLSIIEFLREYSYEILHSKN